MKVESWKGLGTRSTLETVVCLSLRRPWATIPCTVRSGVLIRSGQGWNEGDAGQGQRRCFKLCPWGSKCSLDHRRVKALTPASGTQAGPEEELAGKGWRC